jgi:hypothetical protein
MRELPVPGRLFGPLGAERHANQTLDRQIFLHNQTLGVH